MARELVVRPRARNDLKAIFDFIVADSPKRALTFVDEIEALCFSLLEFPEKGRLRNDLRPGVRLLPFDCKVLIAYEVAGEVVTIIRVFYAGQDPEALRDQGE